MSKRLPLLLLVAASLSAPTVAAISTFDFEGNLNATEGPAVMSLFKGNAFGSFGTDTVGGAQSGVYIFPAATNVQGLRVDHNSPPNGGGSYVNNYTLGFDIKWDSGPEWASFFQTNTNNSNDGDLWRNGAYGIGVNGSYHGLLPPGAYARVMFAVDLAAGPASLSKYINGVLVGNTNIGGVDGRFSLDPSFELLTDNDGETCSGALSAFLYADRTLSAQEIAAFGGPQAGGFNTRAIPEPGTMSLLGIGLLPLLRRRK